MGSNTREFLKLLPISLKTLFYYFPFMEYSKLFHHILGNDALAGFLNMLLWFALTFWAYLETQSVFVTGMLGGIYLVLNLLTGIWF